MASLKVVLVLVTLLAVVYGLPTGAPSSACSSLTPNHGDYSPQMSDVPYTFNLSDFMTSDGSGYEYTPGQLYLLTLRDFNENPNTFRGFLVQARLTADDTTFAGYFGVFNSDASQLGPCDPSNSSITHTNNTDKSLMKMYWTAPSVGTGAIRFAYAVVRTRPVYWANQRSPIINEATGTTTSTTPTSSSATIAPTSTTATPTTSPTATPTTVPPVDNCTGVMCGYGEMCVADYGTAECVCMESYVYQPNSMTCESGNLTLPLSLNPIILPTDGMCPGINTTDARYMIQSTVRDTIVKNRLDRRLSYNYNN